MFLTKASETLNHSSGALGAAYGNARVYGNLIKARSGRVLQYVGTPSVARDMLRIVEAYGEDKLQYWGFS